MDLCLPRLSVLLTLSWLVGFVALSSAPGKTAQQASDLEAALTSVVQIAVQVTATVDGKNEALYIPLGSGTIVSSSGLILTNAHVVDMDAIQTEMDRGNAGSMSDIEVNTHELLVLGSPEPMPAEPRYLAEVVAQDADFDLAVLQITSEVGANLGSVVLSYPSIRLADSDDVELGDSIRILSYPGVGGDAITYTSGVVSGFGFSESMDRRDWINTDATLSGGSSGGAALNEQGDLIGIPTQGSELDCRPGDTNRDGQVTADDLGCVPVGGSIGQLRPINMAIDLLRSVGYSVNTPAGSGASQSPNFAKTEQTYHSDDYLQIVELDSKPCNSGPTYAVGTLLVVGNSGSTGLLRVPISDRLFLAPPGTILKTTASFVESGVCDEWPVEVVSVPSLPADLQAGVSSEAGGFAVYAFIGEVQRAFDLGSGDGLGPTTWTVTADQVVRPEMGGVIDERWVTVAPSMGE